MDPKPPTKSEETGMKHEAVPLTEIAIIDAAGPVRVASPSSNTRDGIEP
jgi:hypothetical protein